jgi:hypothetical protein
MYLPLHAANNFSDFLWLLIVIVTIQCKPFKRTKIVT